MFSILMLIIEIFFFLLSFLSFVYSQRYYAFVETLFVVDTKYFPPLSSMSYDMYIQTIVDTTNIIFQSQNDLDIKIEIIISNIVHLNIFTPEGKEPYVYEPNLRRQIPDYDKYDSIVLLSYQPWEGPRGAQGYAIVKGICHPQNKIMYLLPYQNAAFYLAHEIGHQLGLVHQVNTSCATKSYMSVMTNSHTASYEQARWTTCENQEINNHICEFSCLFNKPDNYQIIKNKFSTLPGNRMTNDQQAKMIEANAEANGEVSSYSYMPSDTTSRCLYLRYYIGGSNGENMYAYSPMLPGSECGQNSICHLDQCVSKDSINPSFLNTEYVTETLDLTKYCNAGGDVNALKASNDDPRDLIQCIDWENDFLCEPSRSCPDSNDVSVLSLYTRHVCCQKCSPSSGSIAAAFNQAEKNQICSIIISISLISSLFLSVF